LDGLDESRFLNEDVIMPVDHDLTDRVIENQVLDGFEKWQDDFKSIH